MQTDIDSLCKRNPSAPCFGLSNTPGPFACHNYVQHWCHQVAMLGQSRSRIQMARIDDARLGLDSFNRYMYSTSDAALTPSQKRNSLSTAMTRKSFSAMNIFHGLWQGPLRSAWAFTTLAAVFAEDREGPAVAAHFAGAACSLILLSKVPYLHRQ